MIIIIITMSCGYLWDILKQVHDIHDDDVNAFDTREKGEEGERRREGVRGRKRKIEDERNGERERQ